jgi:predicted nucleotidyltransferase
MQDEAGGKFGLKPSTLQKIKEVFARHPEVEQVILYGSRAKGNYRQGSDIDLAIQGDSVTLTQLLRIENELEELLLPYTIDLSHLQKIENPELVEHISRVGAVFYDKEQAV